ncbi:MAG: hypothetical protein JXR37_21800 [Kiritimatiellae bacterium]|nr:hypothetical protein [Kiritimatiellia bacterium]
MRNAIRILGVMSAAAIGAPARGATYYVDFDGGHDSASGTQRSHAFKHCPGNPEATNRAAATALNPGDTVLFKGGVEYRATLRIVASGEPGRPVIYDGNSDGSWGEGRAIIEGEQERQYGIRGPEGKAELEHVTIRHFELRNLRNVYPDFPGCDPRGVTLHRAANLRITDCRLHKINRPAKPILDIRADTSRIQHTQDSFSDAETDLSAYAGQPGKQATHEVHMFWNNGNMKHLSDYNRACGYIGERLAGRPGSVRIYQDAKLTKPGWAGPKSNVPLPAEKGYDGKPAGDQRQYMVFNMKEGSFKSKGGFCMDVSGRHIEVDHCEIGDAEFAICAYGRDVDIHHNDIFATTAALMGGADRMRFHDNRVRDAYKFATTFGYHVNAIHLWSFTRNGKSDPIEGFECYNNTVLWASGSATSVFYLEGNIPAPKIHHNVIINVDKKGREPSGYIYLVGKGHLADDRSDGEIYNNLVVGLGKKQPVMVRTGTRGVKVANNIFVNHRVAGGMDNNVYVAYTGNGLKDVKKGFAAYEKDARTSFIVEDPKAIFVDPDNLDYRPKPGSPVIDAGRDVGIGVDMAGTPIPQGAGPDIGPYEYR